MEFDGHGECAVRIKFQSRFCRDQVAPACQFLQTGLHFSGAMAMHEKRNESATIAKGICLSTLSDQDVFLHMFADFCRLHSLKLF